MTKDTEVWEQKTKLVSLGRQIKDSYQKIVKRYLWIENWEEKIMEEGRQIKESDQKIV